MEEILRQKINAYKTEFDTDHWLKARKLIDDERQHRNTRFRLLLFSLLLITFGGVGTLFVSRNSSISSGNEQQIALSEKSTPHTLNRNRVLHVNDLSETIPSTTVIFPVPIEKTDPDQSLSTTIQTGVTDEPASSKNEPVSENEREMIPEADGGQVPVNISRSDQEPETISIKSQTDGSTVMEEAISYSEAQLTFSYIIPRTFQGFSTPVNPENHDLSFSSALANTRYDDRSQANSFPAIEAGITAFNPAGNLVDIMNFTYGFRYYNMISPGWGLNIGLFYTRLHQNLGERIYYDVNYDFGKNITTTAITTARLDYIEVPLNVSYSFNKRHVLNAGVSYLHLVSSAEQVTVSEPQQRTSRNAKGYLDAIRNDDFLLNLDYSFFINANFYLRGGVYYGINDISDNLSFKSTRDDRNKGLKVTLGYKLYK